MVTIWNGDPGERRCYYKVPLLAGISELVTVLSFPPIYVEMQVFPPQISTAWTTATISLHLLKQIVRPEQLQSSPV